MKYLFIIDGIFNISKRDSVFLWGLIIIGYLFIALVCLSALYFLIKIIMSFNASKRQKNNNIDTEKNITQPNVSPTENKLGILFVILYILLFITLVLILKVNLFSFIVYGTFFIFIMYSILYSIICKNDNDYYKKKTKSQKLVIKIYCIALIIQITISTLMTINYPYGRYDPILFTDDNTHRIINEDCNFKFGYSFDMSWSSYSGYYDNNLLLRFNYDNYKCEEIDEIVSEESIDKTTYPIVISKYIITIQPEGGIGIYKRDDSNRDYYRN